MHVIAGKAVALKEAMTPAFKAYQTQVKENAQTMANAFLEQGISLVSNGTDNHLMLVKLAEHGTTGKEIEALLDECHITVNKNAIPNDSQSPFITSGIRIGTPSVTTRGMKEAEMREIAALIARIIKEKRAALPEVTRKVAALTERFPLYRDDVWECE